MVEGIYANTGDLAPLRELKALKEVRRGARPGAVAAEGQGAQGGVHREGPPGERRKGGQGGVQEGWCPGAGTV